MSGDAVADLLRQGVSGLLGGAFLVALLAYFRDRRGIKAKGDIAVGTVAIQIDADRLALLERRLVAINESFEAERKVKDATIAHLRADLEEERRESEEKDRKIAELVKRVEEIQASLDAVKRELALTQQNHQPSHLSDPDQRSTP